MNWLTRIAHAIYWALRDQRRTARTGTRVYKARFRRHALLPLLLAGVAHADGIIDATVYVPIQVQAAEVDEAVPVFRISASLLPAEFWTALAAESDTTCATCRFTNSDGTVELPIYVPDTFNTGTETGAIFVRGTGMSASVDVDYRLYAGSPTASMYATSATNGRDDVFDGYAAVYGTTGSHRLADWTGINGDLTELNSPTADVSLGIEGLTGYGVVAASSQGLYTDSAPRSGLPVTMLTFFESNDTDNTYVVSAIASSASNTSNRTMQLNSSGTVTGDPVQAFVHGGGGSNSNAGTSTGISINTTYMAGGSRDAITSGTTTATINGGSAGTNTGNLAAFGTSNRFSLGFRRGLANQAFHDGTVGMTIVNNAVLSTDYQATLYRAITSATFYDVGAAVELGGSCTSGSTGWVLFQSIAQTATAANDWANITDALVDDANTADTTLDDVTNIQSEQLLFDNINYGTTVPTDADSYTVSLRVKKDFQEGAAREIRDLVVKFVDDTGTLVGDNLAITGSDWPSSPGTVDYTVTGVTFDGSEFDADTGMALSAEASGTNGNTLAEVYVAWIKVDWVCGDDAAASARGFFELVP